MCISNKDKYIDIAAKLNKSFEDNDFEINNKNNLLEVLNFSRKGYGLHNTLDMSFFCTVTPNTSVDWNGITIDDNGTYICTHTSDGNFSKFTWYDITSYAHNVLAFAETTRESLIRTLTLVYEQRQSTSYDIDANVHRSLNMYSNWRTYLSNIITELREESCLTFSSGGDVPTIRRMVVVSGVECKKLCPYDTFDSVVERILTWPVVIDDEAEIVNYALAFECSVDKGLMETFNSEWEEQVRHMKPGDIIEHTEGIITSKLYSSRDFKRIKLLYYQKPMVFVVTSQFIADFWAKPIDVHESVE